MLSIREWYIMAVVLGVLALVLSCGCSPNKSAANYGLHAETRPAKAQATARKDKPRPTPGCICGCPGPKCDCVDCPTFPVKTKPADDYAACRARAIREGRRLVCWIGCRHPATEAKLPGCVHYHCDRLAGIACGVMVGVPDGAGDLDRFDLPAGATAGDIRAAAAPVPEPQFQPSFAPACFGGG